MAEREMAKFIAQHRGKFNDKIIRQRLVQDGYSSEVIDAAFKLVDRPSRAGVKRALFLGLGILGGLIVFGFAGIYFMVSHARTMRNSFDSEINSTQTQPPSSPISIDEFLPANQVAGNAGEDYLSFWQTTYKAAKTADQNDKTFQQKTLARFGEVLDQAVKKKSNAIRGVLWTPGTLQESVEFVQFASVLGIGGKGHFDTLIDTYKKQGNTDGALENVRDLIALGYHMTQDWDTSSQILGHSLIVSGALSWVTVKKVPVNAPERKRLVQLIKETQANIPNPQELAQIMVTAKNPQALGQLKKYIDEMPLKKPYSLWALQAALIQLTDQEAMSHALDRSRRAFVESATASGDPRIATLGRSCLQLAADIENDLRQASPENRLKAVREMQSGMERMIKAGSK